MSDIPSSNGSRHPAESTRPLSNKSDSRSPSSPTPSRKATSLRPSFPSRSTLGGPGISVSSRISFWNNLTQTPSVTSQSSDSSSPSPRKDKGKGGAVIHQSSVSESSISFDTAVHVPHPPRPLIPAPQPTSTISALTTPAKKIFRMAQAVISLNSDAKAQPIGKLSTSVEVEVEEVSAVFSNARFMASDRTVNNFYQDETGARVHGVGAGQGGATPGGRGTGSGKVTEEDGNKYQERVREDSLDWEMMMERRREEARKQG
ncbi:hypothetical protein T440DRAFT_517802 [Plenodomus tracheiphilus IPT5]|uniref:Uncharacterized protein n=1 Tax=Plenodomus tracheiphilus IPT5 TaxID=1408161 RepID=A0A6A7B923_9PLEO|nr:hypothetical protein T440DRAFT_517802 [Plenodomus tracheiphilus IPT5]